MKKFYFIILGCILFSSCEEECIKIPDAIIPAEGRGVLVEELTGVSCPPCAAASVGIKNIAKDSDGGVIYYAIHGNLQSNPTTSSIYDFRYPAAADLESSFSFFGKPAAAFNRVPLPDNVTALSGFGNWQSFIDEELQKPQVMNISMSSEYNSDTRQATVFIGVSPLEDIDGPTNIHVVVSESNLIDAQLTPSEVIPDFEHSHVMKATLTSLSGDSWGTDLKANETKTITYSYVIPEENNGEWIPENIEFTAFITATDRGGEVQHAAQIHIGE